MSEMWKQWQGRMVDGRFVLQSYLGGSDHSAVFLTVVQDAKNGSQRAAIKLITAGAADGEAQLLRWKRARELTHPNLLRIFEAGRCKLDDAKLLYVVEEYAEENLSQILPERSLTPEEAGGMLPPVLRVLQFVHDKGLVHGRIQPSNILAIGDELKLSSDSLALPSETRTVQTVSAYDPPENALAQRSPATDVWQLGMTLVEVLTQRLPAWDRARSKPPDVPAALPEPFREIAASSLQVDAEKRWSITQILGRLGEPLSKASVSPVRLENEPVPRRSVAAKSSSKWPYALAAALVLALVIFTITRSKPSSAPTESPTKENLSPQPTTNSTATESANGSNTGPHADTGDSLSRHPDSDGVVRRVMPQVSPGARRTIHGKIRLRLRVQVDAAGNVTDTKIESGGPSPYFRRIATEACHDWKFVPTQPGESNGDRAWRLQFFFTRGGTEASAERLKR